MLWKCGTNDPCDQEDGHDHDHDQTWAKARDDAWEWSDWGQGGQGGTTGSQSSRPEPLPQPKTPPPKDPQPPLPPPKTPPPKNPQPPPFPPPSSTRPTRTPQPPPYPPSSSSRLRGPQTEKAVARHLKHANKPFNNDRAKLRRMENRRTTFDMLHEAYEFEIDEALTWAELAKDGALEMDDLAWE